MVILAVLSTRMLQRRTLLFLSGSCQSSDKMDRLRTLAQLIVSLLLMIRVSALCENALSIFNASVLTNAIADGNSKVGFFNALEIEY